MRPSAQSRMVLRVPASEPLTKHSRKPTMCPTNAGPLNPLSIADADAIMKILYTGQKLDETV